MPSPMENIKLSRTVLLVAALVATTSGLALFHLGDKPLWIDEGYSWMRTQAAERPLSNDPVHPELYYDLLDVWVGWFGGSEFSLRFPSFLAYAAAIPLVYGIGRIVHSPRAGVLATLLVATSPFVFHYASEARAYALLLLLCSLMFFCLAALLKDRNAWHPMGIALWSLTGGSGWDSTEVKRGLLWVGLIASTLAAMFTHFVALPLPILVASILIVGSLFERGQRWSLLVNVAEMSALVILGWWVCPYGLADLPSWAPPGSNIGPSLPVIERLSRLISIYGAGGHLSVAAFVFGGCAVWGLGHWFGRRAAGRKWIILIVAGCLPGFVYILVTEFLFTPGSKPYPFIWTITPFSVLVAIGLCSLPRRWLFPLALGVLLSLNAFGMVVDWQSSKRPWDTIMADLSSRAGTGDGVILCMREWRSGVEPYYSGLGPDPGMPGVKRYWLNWNGRVHPSTKDLTARDRFWLIGIDSYPQGRCGDAKGTAFLQDYRVVYQRRFEAGAGGIARHLMDLPFGHVVRFPHSENIDTVLTGLERTATGQ